MSAKDYRRNRQGKENNTEDNGHPEECFFNATPGSEYATGIGTRQPAQARTLALQDDTDH